MTNSPKLLTSFFAATFFFLAQNSISAQVICINCYQQNERITEEGENLILNGGFEEGCNGGEYFCPNSDDYQCDISNWTCTGGGFFTYASCISLGDESLIVEGTKAIYFGNAFCVACSIEQDTSCLNMVDCTVNGIPAGFPLSNEETGGADGISLEQNINGLIVGEIYQLEFWAGGEFRSNQFSASGLFSVDIGLGKIYLRDPITPAMDGIGIRYVIAFKAWSSSTTIRFTNWGHISTDATELILDDVRLMISDESNNPCIVSTEENNVEEQISIIPNPFQNTAILEISNDEFQHRQLLIFNSIGHLVQKIIVSQSSTIIERNTLPGGIYFYQLVSNHQKVHTGKFMIE